MTSERRDRTEKLIGSEGVARLEGASVMIFGLGGVGGYALEALARAGVGELWLVDFDTVSESNCNRQLLALTETVGRLKTEVAAERARSINPDAVVHTVSCFADEESIPALLAEASPSYIVDAIDTVKSKLTIIREAKARGIPVISCMGTGNKLDPSRFVIGDLAVSSVCPLARVMRAELRHLGISGVTALWSTEEPTKAVAENANGRHSPASISYVPSVAGLLIGGYVIRELSGIHMKGTDDQ